MDSISCAKCTCVSECSAREFAQKYLLRAYDVPGTMLETRNMAENSVSGLEKDLTLKASEEENKGMSG